MFQYRQVLVRLRQGDSDRDIARCRLMGRRKVAALRALAAERGWLAPEAALPDDETIATAVGQARRARSTISSAEPYRTLVERWAARREHGYRGSYSAVRRMLAGIRSSLPPDVTVPLTFAPPEAAQVRKLTALARVPLSYWLAGIAFYRPEELADSRRLSDGGEVPRLDRCQCVFEVRRDVVLCAASRHCVAEHPPRQRTHSVRSLVRPTCLDASERCEEFLSSNRRDRTIPDIRVQKALEPRTQDLHRLGRQRLALQLEPFTGDGLERLRVGGSLGLPSRVPHPVLSRQWTARDADRLDLQGFPDFLRRR